MPTFNSRQTSMAVAAREGHNHSPQRWGFRSPNQSSLLHPAELLVESEENLEHMVKGVDAVLIMA